MNLADASRYFDRTEVFDPDTGRCLFKAQMKNYDDSHRDNASAYRRVMSVAPGTPMPAARSIRMLGDTWLVGDRQRDGQANAHRDKFVVQRTPAQGSVYSLAGFLAGTRKALAWMDMLWLADRKELEVSSDVPQQYLAYYPETLDVMQHDVVVHQGKAIVVQSAAHTGSGISEARGLLQATVAPTNVIVNKRTFVPSTGRYTTNPTVTVQGLLMRWQELYRYEAQSDERYQEGDRSLVLPAATAINNSDTVTAGGRNWSVTGVQPISGCAVAHLRPL